METVQQHEFIRTRRFCAECSLCGCLEEPTGDREGAQYSLDNGLTWTEEEPPCITRTKQSENEETGKKA